MESLSLEIFEPQVKIFRRARWLFRIASVSKAAPPIHLLVSTGKMTNCICANSFLRLTRSHHVILIRSLMCCRPGLIILVNLLITTYTFRHIESLRSSYLQIIFVSNNPKFSGKSLNVWSDMCTPGPAHLILVSVHYRFLCVTLIC